MTIIVEHGPASSTVLRYPRSAYRGRTAGVCLWPLTLDKERGFEFLYADVEVHLSTEPLSAYLHRLTKPSRRQLHRHGECLLRRRVWSVARRVDAQPQGARPPRRGHQVDVRLGLIRRRQSLSAKRPNGKLWRQLTAQPAHEHARITAPTADRLDRHPVHKVHHTASIEGSPTQGALPGDLQHPGVDRDRRQHIRERARENAV